MFCPNCGNGEQAPDSYCRSCGEFLADFSSKSYLINKLLGGSTPDVQVNVNLIISVVTTLVSILLLGFLNGFYDAQFARTGEGAPKVIYLVYAFLGLVTIWQFLSFLINLKLKKKLSTRKMGDASARSTVLEGVSQQRHKALTQADIDTLVRPSVTEETTKPLEKAPR